MEDKEIKKESKLKSKKIIVPVIGLLIAITLVGLSYAVWTYTFSGSLKNTIATPTVELELLESQANIINIQNALPESDAQGKQEETFDFAVTSKTLKDIDISYTVSIEKLSVDTGYTSLNDNNIKLYLTDYSGSAIWTSATNNVKKVSELNNYVLTTGTHSHDSTHNKIQDKYKLRAWISSDTDASSWTSATKLQYKFRIGVTSSEVVPSAYPEYVYSYHTNAVVPGEPLSQTTETKWVATSSGMVLVKEDTEAACNTKKLVYGISDACTEQSVSWGIGSYETDYGDLNKTFFLKHNISNQGTVESSEVCFIRNNTLYCLKGGGATLNNETHQYNNDSVYYTTNQSTLLEAFGPNAVENNVCSVDSNGVGCGDSISGLDANAAMFGLVGAGGDSSGCEVYEAGVSHCVE